MVGWLKRLFGLKILMQPVLKKYAHVHDAWAWAE